jgi:TPR repeat protein
MEKDKNKFDSDKWYADHLKILIDRYKSILKQRTDFNKYTFPNNIEDNSNLITLILTLLPKLGASFPDIPGVEVLKLSIAQDIIRWMKEERPDILNGMLGMVSDSPQEQTDDYFTSYDELKQKGNELYAEKKFLSAIENYEKALKLKGLNKNQICILHSNIANSYYEIYENSNKLENLDYSLFHAEKSVESNPDWAKGYFRMAKILEIKSLDEKALELYEKCNILMPNVTEVENLISKSKLKIFDKKRNSNLFDDSYPKSGEERMSDLMSQLKIMTGQSFSEKEINKMTEIYKKYIPGFTEVLLGHKYRDGDLTTKVNYELSAQYYSKAMKKNNPEGIYNLALLYSSGKGVNLDYKMSTELLEMASKCDPKINIKGVKYDSVGVAQAQHVLGIRYMEGIYVEKNTDKAIRYFEEAYSNGSGDAANNLGVYYTQGQGVEVNYKKAEKMLLFAHSKFIPQALSNLVDLYIAMRDSQSALKWQNKAIQEGCIFSRARDREVKYLIEKIKK